MKDDAPKHLWTIKRDGVTYFVQIVSGGVEIGDLSGRGDQGTACSKEAFLQGKFNAFVREIFGKDVLQDIKDQLM